MRESLEIKDNIFNKQSIVYHYQIEIKSRVSEIERRTVTAGRFILATNIELTGWLVSLMVDTVIIWDNKLNNNSI